MNKSCDSLSSVKCIKQLFIVIVKPSMQGLTLEVFELLYFWPPRANCSINAVFHCEENTFFLI